MKIARVRAFGIGICVGLVFNACIAPNAIAVASLQPNVPIGPPVPIPDWGEQEFIDENTLVYESLFPGDVWDFNSTLKVSAPMIAEGRNDGISNEGNEFRLQAFVVSEFDITEITASLTEDEQDAW